MINNLLLIVLIVPTVCYALASCIWVYQGNNWAAIMWAGYAVANIAIMKQQGLF